MSEIKTNYTKKGKPKMFLLFLFVTTFIWFISKFSREFTSNLEAEIHYINTPLGVIVSENNYDIVSFDFTTMTTTRPPNPMQRPCAYHTVTTQ